MSETGKDNIIIENQIREVSKEIYNDLIENKIHPLNNHKIYNFIDHLPASQKEKLLRRYEWRSREYNQFKQELGENFTTCIFHPGVDTRQKDFISFAKQLRTTNPQITTFQTVQDFGNNLGDIQIYRGMALKPEDIPVIEKSGILAPALLKKERGLKALYNLLDPSTPEFDFGLDYPSDFGSDANSRSTDLGVDAGSTISTSTSAFKEVASSVGWHTSGNTNKEGFVPYIFTLQVPKMLCYQEEDIERDYRGPEKIKIGDKIFGRKGMEIFVPFAILPKYIKRVERTEIPPRWLGFR
jgi:hypothetical protein